MATIEQIDKLYELIQKYQRGCRHYDKQSQLFIDIGHLTAITVCPKCYQKFAREWNKWNKTGALLQRGSK